MNTDKKVYVIGGGPLGLGMAHEFLENNVAVTIIEAGPKLLGLADTFKHNGLEVEKYYHFFYKNDHFMSVDWLKHYSDEEPEIYWRDITTDSVVSGSRYDFDSITTIIKLSGFNVFRAGWTFLMLMFRKPNKKLDSISAESWATKVFGSKFANSVWLPLLKQKFGARSSDVSALWLATRIKRHLSTKGQGVGKSRFGYLIDTYVPYVKNFSNRLSQEGGKVILSDPVIKIIASEDKVTKIITSSSEIDVSNDIVFSSIPLANLRELMPEPNPIPLLEKFVNVGVVVCILFLKRPLSRHYWTTVSDEQYPFSAIIQQNRLYAKSSEEIVYLSRYCESSDNLMSSDESTLIHEWVEALSDIFPDFLIDDLIEAKVLKAKNAAPVPYVGAIEDLSKLHSPFTNFYFAGYEHIFPEDRGVGNSISVGRKAVKNYKKFNLD